jgi:hypothetical protein
VLDEARNRLYVLTRFDDAVSVVDLAGGVESSHLRLHDPEPPSVVAGRPFLYDALHTSSNGEASCSSCHIFGDMDDLAWDLGNPDDAVKKNPIPINLAIAIESGLLQAPGINGTGLLDDFHPMKGPMTTQTLRGMLGSGAMHWRGDRSNPPGDAFSAFSEFVSFNNFNPAFVGLLGRTAQLPSDEMVAFTDFILQVTLPPNPNRAIDGSLDAAQSAGRSFFLGPRRSDGLANDLFGFQVGFTCEGCHTLDPGSGHFGTAGRASFEGEQQIVKIPHLRNMYQKVGMFGIPDVAFADPFNQPFQGDQIRGFGFLHDGSVDTIFRFHNAAVFNQMNPGGFPFLTNPGGFPNGSAGDPLRRQVEQFILAFDSNLAPIVGQQVTLTSGNAATVGARIDLLVFRDALNECDLVVKGTVAGEQRGWASLGVIYGFRSDRANEPLLGDAALRALAATPGQELTYTCTPPGSGFRVGIDRDEDGFFDRDELDLGSDPADPNSTPAPFVTTTTTPVTTTTTSTTVPPYGLIRGRLTLTDDNTLPIDLARRRKVTFRADTKSAGPDNHFFVPYENYPEAPITAGATLEVYNSNPALGSPTDVVTVPLPAQKWVAIAGIRPKYVYTDLSPNAPISQVKATANSLRFKGKGAGWSYTLEEASQGRVAMRITFGASTIYRYCADLPAKPSGVPPTTARNDRVDKFTGFLKEPATTCPSPKGAGSPSGAFVME